MYGAKIAFFEVVVCLLIFGVGFLAGFCIGSDGFLESKDEDE